MMSRLLSCFFAFVFSMAPAFSQPKPVYAIFTSDGNVTDYGKMTEALSEADVIFIGETHNCPVAHWMEYEITKDMLSCSPDGLTLGAEMLEADNQLLVDGYVSGLITSDRFESEARLWDNHCTDYAPLLYLARENGLKFVATNVPRRYASFVKEYGLDTLASLSGEAKRLMAPLPISLPSSEEGTAMFGFMSMMGGRGNFAEAQALKDATMAWFISQNIKGRFIHYNGNFHSDFRGGIIPYLEAGLPGKKIMTVCCIRQDSLGSLDEENLHRADFIIVASVDFPMSY